LGQPDGSCKSWQPPKLQVAITVVLEQLKREELKRKNKESEE
jgi:hypothetical protein